MKTLSESYAAFCSLLEFPENLSLSFEELCARVHVSPVDLGRLLESELGYTGDALVSTLRASVHL